MSYWRTNCFIMVSINTFDPLITLSKIEFTAIKLLLSAK